MHVVFLTYSISYRKVHYMTENKKLDLILSEIQDMRTDIQNLQEKYVAMSENRYETIRNSAELEMLSIKVRRLETEVRNLKEKVS